MYIYTYIYTYYIRWNYPDITHGIPVYLGKNPLNNIHRSPRGVAKSHHVSTVLVADTGRLPRGLAQNLLGCSP